MSSANGAVFEPTAADQTRIWFMGLRLIGVAVTGAGDAAAFHDDVVPVQRLSSQKAVQTLADAIGVAFLGL